MARSRHAMARRLIAGGRIKFGEVAGGDIKGSAAESTFAFCLFPFVLCLSMLNSSLCGLGDGGEVARAPVIKIFQAQFYL